MVQVHPRPSSTQSLVGLACDPTSLGSQGTIGNHREPEPTRPPCIEWMVGGQQNALFCFGSIPVPYVGNTHLESAQQTITRINNEHCLLHFNNSSKRCWCVHYNTLASCCNNNNNNSNLQTTNYAQTSNTYQNATTSSTSQRLKSMNSIQYCNATTMQKQNKITLKYITREVKPLSEKSRIKLQTMGKIYAELT